MSLFFLCQFLQRHRPVILQIVPKYYVFHLSSRNAPEHGIMLKKKASCWNFARTICLILAGRVHRRSRCSRAGESVGAVEFLAGCKSRTGWCACNSAAVNRRAAGGSFRRYRLQVGDASKWGLSTVVSSGLKTTLDPRYYAQHLFVVCTALCPRYRNFQIQHCHCCSVCEHYFCVYRRRLLLKTVLQYCGVIYFGAQLLICKGCAVGPVRHELNG